MASIRDVILGALVARLATIVGWNVQLRGVENRGNFAVTAIVYYVGEDKYLATSDQYQATLNVGVEITARMEDADPDLDAGNPYRYLDRLVAAAESQVHNPDEWGVNPAFSDVQIAGHDVAFPEEGDTEVAALLRLTFKYRHHYQDPGA